MEKTGSTDLSIEEKLKALYQLQITDSEVDKIRTLRGELPLEVEDLEDEIAGLETRGDKYQELMTVLEKKIAERKGMIKESEGKIKKYKTQQENVRNNREYEALSKEIEFQELDIQLSEKRIKEHKVEVEGNKKTIETFEQELINSRSALELKRTELDEIVSETEKEEAEILAKSSEIQTKIDPRLLTAYTRIRNNVQSKLAIVTVERNACRGCFNKIPPQRQLDVSSRKKIIVCEYCGRILVDKELAEEVKIEMNITED